MIRQDYKCPKETPCADSNKHVCDGVVREMADSRFYALLSGETGYIRCSFSRFLDEAKLADVTESSIDNVIFMADGGSR